MANDHEQQQLRKQKDLYTTQIALFRILKVIKVSLRTFMSKLM